MINLRIFQSVQWHADDEAGLGNKPTIASISLGNTRVFELKCEKLNLVKTYSLVDGSLLIMAGATQLDWKHRVPESNDLVPRINLTFRKMF